MSIISISTTRQTSTDKNLIEIFTRANGKKDEKLPEHQRVRSILIPTLDVSAVPSKFSVFVAGALYETARQQLAALWKDDANIKETDSALFTVDGLLAFASRESESKRLTAESVKSALGAFVKTLKQESQETAMTILVSMSSATGRKGNEKQLFALHEKLAGWIEQEESDDYIVSTVCSRMLTLAEEKKAERLAFAEESEAF